MRCKGKPLPVYGDGQNVRDWLFGRMIIARQFVAVCPKGRLGETDHVGGANEQQQSLRCGDTFADLRGRVRPNDPVVGSAPQLIKYVLTVRVTIAVTQLTHERFAVNRMEPSVEISRVVAQDGASGILNHSSWVGMCAAAPISVDDKAKRYRTLRS